MLQYLIVAARSTKLALYTSLQNSILKHKDLLSDREKVLEEAREGLVREGGAVVGEQSVSRNESARM